MLVNTFCAKSLVSTDSPSRFYVLFLPLGNTILENTKEYFLQHLMSILKKKQNKSAAEKGVFLQKQQKSDPNFTSSRLQMFCKIVCFKNFAKFTGKHICRILFFDKVTVLWPATFFKKQTLTQIFSNEFCKIFQNIFFIKHLRSLVLCLGTQEHKAYTQIEDHI